MEQNHLTILLLDQTEIIQKATIKKVQAKERHSNCLGMIMIQ